MRAELKDRAQHSQGPPGTSARVAYSFGPFTLEPVEHRLTREHRLVAVPGKAWQILLMLVEARGQLVPQESFRARLWPNTIVEDRTLTVHMSTLRKALGAGPPTGYIETVTGAGYRLAVPVRVLSAAEAPKVLPSHPPGKPLAVRAFSTHGMAETDSYLGVGIADALSTELGTVPGLKVSPVGTVDRCNNSVEMGRELGLGHVLEGSVELNDQQLEVSARLIDVTTGLTQWNERFTQPKAQGPALQDAIVRKVAGAVADMSGGNREADVKSYRPRTTEAYFLQMQARANLRLFARLSTIKALGLFEHAIALDPDYALAHAGLATTYVRLTSTSLNRPLPAEEAMPIARASAERALTLDDRLAEAWGVLGRVKMEYDWDWDGAEADLVHAVAINPSSVEALTAYGQYLSAMGRHDEAIATTDHAHTLDTRNVEILQHLGIVYWMAGQCERALELFAECLVISPHAIQVHLPRIYILDQLGRHEEAMVERLTFVRHLPEARVFADQLDKLNRNEGWRAAMTAWISYTEMNARHGIAAIQWMALDEPERAIAALEHCVTQKATYLRFGAVCPAWLPLRGNPRFEKVLRSLKLEGRVVLPWLAATPKSSVGG
jgi:serine/threonine-protein kinase